MLAELLPWLSDAGRFSYAVLFAFAFGESIAVIGIIVPGATFVVLFGFIISQGYFGIFDAMLIAAAGAILGDVFSFALGRRGVNPAKKFPTLFSQSTVDRAEKFMLDYGVAGVFLGRFIGPLRPFVPFVSGALKMRWRSFMIMNVASGILWAMCYLGIGYFFGQFWLSFHRGFRWVGIGVVIIIVVYAWIAIVQHRRQRQRAAQQIQDE